jgi:hypothetical protein
MRRYIAGIVGPVLCLAVLAALSIVPSFAGDDAAIVTRLDGQAKAYDKGRRTGSALHKNDRLMKGQEVRVGDRSRIELRFPDGTVMRFAERSSVKMDDILFDPKTQEKKVRVDLTGGKLWANVKKLVTSESTVEVKTVNAVAGVRGTVYRVNVDEDNSAMVKVYDGSVYVAGRQQGTAQQVPPSGPPVPVAGPHEVPPPYHEVTMEEWHVIVKSFQQVTISPQGVASEPQDFNPQEDRDDWVEWNQERDNRQPQ